MLDKNVARAIRELNFLDDELRSFENKPVKNVFESVMLMRNAANRMRRNLESMVKPLQAIDDFINVSWNWYQSSIIQDNKHVYSSVLTEKRNALFSEIYTTKDIAMTVIDECIDEKEYLKFVFIDEQWKRREISIVKMLFSDYGISEDEEMTIYTVQAYIQFLIETL